MGTYDSAANVEVFKNTFKKLSHSRLYSDIGVKKTIEIDENDIERSAWIASVLANSPEDDHRQQALSFTVLAYLWAKENGIEDLYREYFQLVMSRIGSSAVAEQYLESIPSLLHEENLQESDNQLTTSHALQTELNLTRNHYLINQNMGETVLTRFQSRVWDSLNNNQYVGFSGPTSSGKSFLMQQYVQRQLAENEEFVCVYIVPTRALIAEVASEFGDKIDLDGVVRTNVSSEDVTGPQIYVLTPERCLNIHEMEEEIEVDLFFIDEVQNLEGGSRGALFEYVYELLVSTWPDAQVVATGPFISNVKKPVEDLRRYGTENEDWDESGDDGLSVNQTDYSPIYRLRTSMTFSSGEDEIDLKIKDQIQETESDSIKRPTGFSYSTVGNNYNTVQKFIEKFQKEDEPILVYANAPHRARDMAKRIAEHRERSDSEFDFPSLVDFLRSSIHPEYPLIDTLQSGVAYHHGGVPQVARGEVERLYREGKIDVIVSTSTLLEGVNLPTAKIVVVDHKGADEDDLTPFQLKNLIGRVGRIGSRLHGQVFYIDREDDEWAAEKVEQSANKEIVPVTTRLLQNSFDSLLNILDAEPTTVPHGELRSAAVMLKSRYAIDEESTTKFLRLKQIDQDKTRILTTRLAEITDDLDIPPDLIEKNPTIDPEVQDSIYTSIKDNPKNWIIDEDTLGSDISRIIEGLEERAKIINTGFHNENYTETYIEDPGDLSDLATEWIMGKSYREIIKRQDSIDESDDNPTSDLIYNIRNDVRYVLVKYIKLVGDIIDDLAPSNINEEEREFTTSFNRYLERGSFDQGELLLMNMGAARSVAVDIWLPPDLVERRELQEHIETTLPEGFKRTHLKSQGIIRGE